MTNLGPEQQLKGALLLNLGTPLAPQTKEVRAYLKEFLMDPYVIDVPYPIRWLIVNGAVLPTRPKNSAAAYQKIWSERGSPLLFHLLDLTEKVQNQLGQGWIVRPAMRYGQPNIEEAFKALMDKNVSVIKVFPLYPQYSLAATETGKQECLRIAKKLNILDKLQFVEPFYHEDLFIKSFVDVIQDSLSDYKYDHLLFSFHGLPERQVKKTDETAGHCLNKQGCCETIGPANQNCYRAQCFHTAQKIADALELKSSQYTVCFQSRLGRTPWIQPFTDHLYQSLPLRGVKRLAVTCPAFVADCLETLEEIQIRGKEDFMGHGGEDLKLVPSLNSRSSWVHAVVQLLQA